MTPLSPLDRFLLFASVGGMFASLAFYASARTAKYWKAPFVRFARASRTFQAIFLAGLLAVTALGGGKTNDALRLPPRIVRTIPTESLPAWFVAMGHPATDADASGIPDCWEKWTHTRGFASDADPDGDGLTNLAEFEAQTDPIRADTDGDGLDDATELAGLAAGVPDLDPLASATFAADEPDTAEDGIPDLWEDADVPLFYGIDPDGFPWDVPVPEEAANNYDVTVSVTSSRHAVLSWGTDDGESILIPPCTNLALRLRLSADDDQRIALTPHPTVGAATGLWKSELVPTWDSRRNQETEGNRIRTGGGIIVDMEAEGTRFAGVLVGTIPPVRGEPSGIRGNGSRDETGFWFWRKSIEVSGTGYCAIHGPGLIVTAACENVSLPLEWSVPGCGTVADGGFEFVPGSHGWESASTEVVCTKRDDKSRILLQARKTFEAVACERPQTNIVGACWLSSHDPDDPSDHEPRVEEHVVRYFPNCPPTTNVTVVAGFTHDTAILWIRNLVRIVTGLVQHDDTDHCIAVEWASGGSVDLWSFVDPACFSFTNQLSIREASSGAPERAKTSSFPHGWKPRTFNPKIRNFALCNQDGSEVYDRFWLVLYNPEDKRKFEEWYTNNTNLSWTASLPRPPHQLNLSTNAETGEVTASLPSQPSCPEWSQPSRIDPGKYIHHDAVFEIRTEMEGAHGNQATYDSDGKLITSTISAGTADFEGPYDSWGWPTGAISHRDKDVLPFIRALQLDGNPAVATPSDYSPSNLTAPCLHQGSFLDQYIQCRPTIQ